MFVQKEDVPVPVITAAAAHGSTIGPQAVGRVIGGNRRRKKTISRVLRARRELFSSLGTRIEDPDFVPAEELSLNTPAGRAALRRTFNSRAV